MKKQLCEDIVSSRASDTEWSEDICIEISSIERSRNVSIKMRRLMTFVLGMCMLWNLAWGQGEKKNGEWKISLTHNFTKPKLKTLRNSYSISRNFNTINVDVSYLKSFFKLNAGFSFLNGSTSTRLCYVCEDFESTIHDKYLGTNLNAYSFITGIGLYKKIKKMYFSLDFLAELGYSNIILWENYLVPYSIPTAKTHDFIRGYRLVFSAFIPLFKNLSCVIGTQYSMKAVWNHNLRAIETLFGLNYKIQNHEKN